MSIHEQYPLNVLASGTRSPGDGGTPTILTREHGQWCEDPYTEDGVRRIWNDAIKPIVGVVACSVAGPHAIAHVIINATHHNRRNFNRDIEIHFACKPDCHLLQLWISS